MDVEQTAAPGLLLDASENGMIVRRRKKKGERVDGFRHVQ